MGSQVWEILVNQGQSREGEELGTASTSHHLGGLRLKAECLSHTHGSSADPTFLLMCAQGGSRE